MTINDASASTDLLLQPWQTMAFQLSPLIGDSGFCALYGRAARLVAARLGQAVPTAPGKPLAALLAALRGHYAVVDAAAAALTNDALLTTFTKLLTSLIGEALTMQLLDADPAAGSACKPVLEPLA